MSPLPEISPSSRPPLATELYAAGRIIGNVCFDENHEFLKCKAADKDPAACLEKGTEVHKCVYNIFKEISAKAAPQFKSLTDCLDYNDLRVYECKKLQDAFERTFYGVAS